MYLCKETYLMFPSSLKLNSINKFIPFGNEDMIARVLGIKEY